MTTTSFESPSTIKRHYASFSVDTARFTRLKGCKFSGGIPLMYDAEERKVIIDPTDTHTLVYGSTGSLKTRAIVMPAIKILSYAGESMIINDSKGELHARLAGELKSRGYNIVVINFRNPSVGNAWNPLHIPYQFFIEGDIDKASEFANDIANNLMISDRATDDPFWDYSASDLLFGLILLLFRYCKDHNLPVSAVNIGNIIELRRALFANKQQAKNSSLWKYASEDELVAASLSGSIYAPNDTMNSILSVFDQKMRTFTIQPTIQDMLANNDFDIADIGRSKTAVFIITPDEKTSFHKLVSLFIKQSYEYIIYTATLQKENKVENRITYILDEFSSLPPITDMPSMISAARSRDIRFLLVVQSQSSLKRRYAEEAETIISNCTNWIFFTSREVGLLKEISDLCGMQKNHLPNISVFDLQHFSKEKREALVLCGRLKPARVAMLDIDRFGDRAYAVLAFEKGARLERRRLTFELSDELKQKYETYLPGGIPGTVGLTSAQTNDWLAAAPKRDDADGDLNIDELIKKIDERIEAFEKEQAAEQTTQAAPEDK
ncbi:MAG: type IV secretory system conjugative DNA transfer family protein [Clostridiaceae bacterium]